MSRIRSKGSRLDLAMKRLLTKEGIEFEMYPKIVGNPDFLVAQKIAVFCDSSFWHGRNWRKLRAKLEGGSNAVYWVEHIARNRNRDRRMNAALVRMGYKVLRFWDDEVFKHPAYCVRKIVEAAGTEEEMRGK